MKLKVLPRAVRDLANIYVYISVDNDQAAKTITQRLKTSMELITLRPDIGRPSPDSRIREWSVPGLPYLIPYRVRGEVVEILRVFHTSRQRPERWIG